MRILHLVAYPLYSGPIPPTLGLALAQRKLGHTVFLAFDSKRGAFNDYEEAAAPRVEPHGLAPPLRLTLSTKSSPRELWRDVRALREFIGRAQVDVVHLHLSHDHIVTAVAASKRSPVLRVRTFHSERSLVRRFGQAFINRHADLCLVRCSAHRALLLERFAIPPERVHVVKGGIDAAAFPPVLPRRRQEARLRFRLPEQALVVAHVALIAQRGQRRLAQAVAMLAREDLHILYVGRGEGEAQLRECVSGLALGDQVHFAGYLQGSELLDAYAAADAVFLAQAGNDASVRAALEAMASGLPVVAVRTGALAELIDAEVGYAAAAPEPAAIAKALAELVADPAGGRHRGDAAHHYVRTQRSFLSEAQRSIALYEQARSVDPKR